MKVPQPSDLQFKLLWTYAETDLKTWTEQHCNNRNIDVIDEKNKVSPIKYGKGMCCLPRDLQFLRHHNILILKSIAGDFTTEKKFHSKWMYF